MDIKKLIDIGIDKNILVYDIEAEIGQLTTRLISLLICTFEASYMIKPRTILLPIGAKEVIYNEYISGKRINLQYDIFSILDVDIVFMKSYEEEKEILEYYKNREATLVYSDICLCLAYSGEKVILGSY